MRRLVLALAGLVLLAGCAEDVVQCDPCVGDQISLVVRSTDPSLRRVAVRVCIDDEECFRGRVGVVREEGDYGDSIAIPDLGEPADLHDRLFRVTFDDGVSPPVTTVGRLVFYGGSGHPCDCNEVFGEAGVILGGGTPRGKSM